MKKILYLLALIIVIAGCKKTIEPEGPRFAKITFLNSTQYSQGVYISYAGKRYENATAIALLAGSRMFSFYKQNGGEKVLDTLLRVDSISTYFLYQPDTLTPPVLLTELPPPPPVVTPPGPLDNEPAAPDGYMKIKIWNRCYNLLYLQSLEVVLNTYAFDPATGRNALTPFDTIHGVIRSFNGEFALVKRPLKNGKPVTTFALSFLNPETGETYKDNLGNTYGEVTIDMEVHDRNNFMMMLFDNDFSDNPDTYTYTIKEGDHYYFVSAEMSAEN